MRILLTTTSFQDTPGPHHEFLASTGWEVQRERGPLPEKRMLELAGEFDGFLCGDDAITAQVMDLSLPRLKVISKYGIGLDKIDVAHATARRLPVLFTPGVNHTTVAEHAMGLMMCLSKKIVEVASAAREGEWKRVTGRELFGKTIGIIGLGRIGKEVAIRASAFGMKVIAYKGRWDEAFGEAYGVERCFRIDEILRRADVLSLHCPLDDETRGLIRAENIALMKDGAFLINTARGEVVETSAVVAALESGKLGGYGTDVLDEEPPSKHHPLLSAPNCVVTSHIGSRTFESVERQAMRATRNLIEFLTGGTDFIQANQFSE